MSQDGLGQRIPRKIVNNRPVANDIDCECGGTFYASPSARVAHCTGGEMRCTRCRREARKFGKGWSCGVGCYAHQLTL